MLWSQLFIPTLRESPAEAEVASHQLLLRAGYIRQLAAGIYNYLFLAQRSLRRIEAIVREEMDAIGAQELLLPALHPAELWQESGRWDVMGDNLFRLRDRFQRTLCLAMTHEEAMTAVARGELRSYKQLPQIWYQIQTKFRDEPRPRAGLLRVRQFRMKDSYSFDIDAAGLDASYRKHYAAYGRIFERCGVPAIAVEAHSGSMGAGQSHEFAVVAEAGEDTVAVCPGCGYAANIEKAVAAPAPAQAPDPEGDLAPEPFDTPGQKTIAELAKFTGLPETSLIKSLVLVADGKPVLALLRGDHQLSHTKFAAASGDPEFRPAYPEEIQAWFGAGAGSLGPLRREPSCRSWRTRRWPDGATWWRAPTATIRTCATSLRARISRRRCAICGRSPRATCCLRCGRPLDLRKTIEVGHIFKLGLKYSEPMALRVLNAEGREVTPQMGSYGIGIERILCAAIETSHDQDGMILPPSIAPFQAVVTPANMADEAQSEAARSIYRECLALGIDTLLDDRDERPGVKFKDADLIGVPFRVIVGRKLPGGVVELVDRKTRQSVDVPVAEAARALKARL